MAPVGRTTGKTLKTTENPGCVLSRAAAPSPGQAAASLHKDGPGHARKRCPCQDLWNPSAGASAPIMFFPLGNKFLTPYPVCLTVMQRANATAEILSLIKQLLPQGPL